MPAYFDAHCDTLTRWHPLRSCGEMQLDWERLSAYAPAHQVMAIFAPPGEDTPETFRRTLAVLERELGENADLAVLCRSVAELDAAGREGKIGVVLSVEGATLLSCSEEGLLDAYRCGVRLVTLVWNKDNILCGSCNDSGSGLTAEGERFVNVCFDLGVAVDLSHASEATFWDVMNIARRPVICSHSNAKALCDHPRNLTDAQISRIVCNGGCIGLNLYSEFLGDNATLDTVLRHADHILSLGAAANLCLGTDFDGIDSTPEGIEGVQDMARLYEALLQTGLSEQQVQDIFYGNLRRFFEVTL